MAALCDVTERLFKITQLRTCPSLADRYSGRKKINMDCQHAYIRQKHKLDSERIWEGLETVFNRTEAFQFKADPAVVVIIDIVRNRYF